MEQLLTIEFTEGARRWATLLFFWSGYAIWIGLFARGVAPTRDFRGPWTTFCLGWVGVALGSLIIGPSLSGGAFDPLSPSGIGISLFFSIVAMLTYYVFSFLFPRREDEEEEEDEEWEQELANMSREQLIGMVKGYRNARGVATDAKSGKS